MELDKSEIGNIPDFKEWVFLAFHLVCLSIGTNSISYLLYFILFSYTLIQSIKLNFKPTLLLILLSSYHSEFPNAFTSDVFGLKFIYILVVLFLIMNLLTIRIQKKYILFILLLLGLFWIGLILGFFHRYSLAWWVNESFSFLIFFSLIIIVVNKPEKYVKLLLDLLAKYVLYFYPLLVLIAIFTAQEEVLLFDEFEKFYFLALIPLLFLKIDHKKTIVILHLIVILLKAKYTYFSSLNIILMATIVFLIFILSKLKWYKKLLFVLFISVFAYLFYSNSSEFTKFKINQSYVAVNEVLEGDVSAVPRSPRVRVLEFILSFDNLKKEGAFNLIFGNGYGSYIDDRTTRIFKEYGITLNEDDYSLSEIENGMFKKGHGGVPYLPIKMGLFGLILFLFFGGIAFSLSFKRKFMWFGLAAPFYIVTTFSYGLKNFIFVAFITGIAIALKCSRDSETRYLYS